MKWSMNELDKPDRESFNSYILDKSGSFLCPLYIYFSHMRMRHTERQLPHEKGPTKLQVVAKTQPAITSS